MRHLSDTALARLREGPAAPELGGTRYRLLGEIGRGGMGVVYAAEDELLQRQVALKVLEAGGAELGDRMLREAHVLARLEHPGIVPVHDVGKLPDGRVFYAMKLVEGRRLDQHIESLPSIPDRLRIFLRICDAVAFAHNRGVLHRDIKPANVMIGPFGEVLVMDWGLAKWIGEVSPPAPEQGHPGLAGDAAITGNGRVLGTPGYMSPEQARGEVDGLDARSDIFSLGSLLRLFLSEKTSKRPLEAICSKACALQAEARYQAVSELALDVSRYLDGLPVTAYRENIFEKLARFYQRNRFFILLLMAYLLMRLSVLIFFKR